MSSEKTQMPTDDLPVSDMSEFSAGRGGEGEGENNKNKKNLIK